MSSILSKNKQKPFDLRYHNIVKSNFTVHFLGELTIPKRHFEINGPLVQHINVGREREKGTRHLGEKPFIKELPPKKVD